MKQIFDELRKELHAGNAAVLATVIASRGSTPRKAGARMLVREDGSICGTIGGGAVEYQGILASKEAMEKKESLLRTFQLSQTAAADIGMVCGGTVELFMQYMQPEEETIGLCRQIVNALEENKNCSIVLDISNKPSWKMMLAETPDCSVKEGAPDVYVFPLVEAGIVYIFGGGHVARELVPILAHLDFRCAVIDDRAEFSCPEFFPRAEQTLVLNMKELQDVITIRPCDYVCIMTRGHLYDYCVQKQVMKHNPRYIGVMGSKKKIAIVTDKLLADGFSREEIEACHMPIGTDIKAETPAEIAISIAGELIAVRAEKRKARSPITVSSDQASNSTIR